eukprot:scaffold614_cov163-Amphora_coffeaeformis.AAC.3
MSSYLVTGGSMPTTLARIWMTRSAIHVMGMDTRMNSGGIAGEVPVFGLGRRSRSFLRSATKDLGQHVPFSLNPL